MNLLNPMTDLYIYIITALLPLTACMLVFQVNPYHALVLRGILGAVAALVYALFGAADVALTEALVGTMLSITLYAVAVRSSLTLKLGILNEADHAREHEPGNGVERDRPVTAARPQFHQLEGELRKALDHHHMRLELVIYGKQQDLQQALLDKEVHAIGIAQPAVLPQARSPHPELEHGQLDDMPPYHLVTRVHRLYEILKPELSSSTTSLTYASTLDELTLNDRLPVRTIDLEEQHS